ncbi:nucleoid-associated protein [Niallia nealsonii]|uniref:Nucleoid-associated protein n=1 Tax=Niallia nealsonii TaxID=115979 RepID=A0A2N0Z360_9BACI|nr:nucleoid-associated protein [Niallia nealsonii]PKG23919.1 hypothetical protein CWS01_09100 [Niallia nealsonii]
MEIMREVGSIELLKGIVHVIDHKESSRAEKSQDEFDVKNLVPEINKFITEHIRTSVQNQESKLAKFENRQTRVQELINGMLQQPEVNFVKSSQLIANHLFAATPQSAAAGCIVVVEYTNTLENLIAIIKLDKNDAIAYEKNNLGNYELILKGTSLPLPNKKSKLQKCAIIRDTTTITDLEWDTKPGLIVLDKQVADFSTFFYRDFLKSNFLLTDTHKSEKLMDGIVKYLNIDAKLDYHQQHTVLQSFGNKIINGEEFTVEEAALQILSPYYSHPEQLNDAVEQLERVVMEQGMGDTVLKGAMTSKIESVLGIKKIKTTENILISFPSELLDTKVRITDNEDGTQNITISNINIK